jgi:hypothetical protein
MLRLSLPRRITLRSAALTLLAVVVAMLALAARAEAAEELVPSEGADASVVDPLLSEVDTAVTTADAVAVEPDESSQAGDLEAALTEDQPVVEAGAAASDPASDPLIPLESLSDGAEAQDPGGIAQDASQDQGAGVSNGGPGQQAGQVAQTGQVAGADATVVQVDPVNVAVPAIVNSPDSNIVVVQTNAASAGAAAVNSSNIVQTVQQAQGGGVPVQPPSGGDPFASPDSAVEIGGGVFVWIWDWDWTWTVDIVVPPVSDWPFPDISDWSIPGVTTPWPSLGSLLTDPATPAGQNGKDDQVRDASNGAGASSSPAGAPPAVLLDSSEGAAGAKTLSSNFVQRSAASAPDWATPFMPPSPAAPSGAAGGAGLSPVGLVLGALLALAFQLASAASLLGRRFSLSRVAWRRQAYAAPLERPG